MDEEFEELMDVYEELYVQAITSNQPQIFLLSYNGPIALAARDLWLRNGSPRGLRARAVHRWRQYEQAIRRSAEGGTPLNTAITRLFRSRSGTSAMSLERAERLARVNSHGTLVDSRNSPVIPPLPEWETEIEIARTRTFEALSAGRILSESTVGGIAATVTIVGGEAYRSIVSGDEFMESTPEEWDVALRVARTADVAFSAVAGAGAVYARVRNNRRTRQLVQVNRLADTTVHQPSSATRQTPNTSSRHHAPTSQARAGLPPVSQMQGQNRSRLGMRSRRRSNLRQRRRLWERQRRLRRRQETLDLDIERNVSAIGGPAQRSALGTFTPTNSRIRGALIRFEENLTGRQRFAIRHVFGANFAPSARRSLGSVFDRVWRRSIDNVARTLMEQVRQQLSKSAALRASGDVSGADKAHTQARRLATEAYNRVRDRFWHNAFSDRILSVWLRATGMNPGRIISSTRMRSPYLRAYDKNGREVRIIVELEHFRRRKDRPDLAIDGPNLGLTTRSENSGENENIKNRDVFQP